MHVSPGAMITYSCDRSTSFLRLALQTILFPSFRLDPRSSGMSRVLPCGDTAGGASRDQKNASTSAASSGSR